MAELFENFLQLAVTTIGVIISFLKLEKTTRGLICC